MKAVAVAPGTREIQIVDHPAPKLSSPTDVKLRVLEVGVCGTDKEISTFEYGTPPSGSNYLVMEDRTPFEQDRHHAAYDPEYAQRCWRILVQADRVLTDFRFRFSGKVSLVHFFWGAFDLAVTRFSGRSAPQHPGAPNVAKFVAREAYSHEVSSCGFWPGGGPVDRPVFYAYAYPEPEGFKAYPIEPREAFYSDEMREFLLPYDAVRTSTSPDQTLLAFLQSTYESAANLGKWDRAALERAPAR